MKLTPSQQKESENLSRFSIAARIYRASDESIVLTTFNNSSCNGYIRAQYNIGKRGAVLHNFTDRVYKI